MLMRSREIPESIAITIKGNPEFITDEQRNNVADWMLEEAVTQLTGRGEGKV